MNLQHIKVLETGGFITGPLASSMLSELGADVTKVERRGTGDPFRAFGRGLYSPVFRSINWGKRSITLDLQTVEGVDIYRELAKRSDVVIENFRPGTAQKVGIDYEELRKANPQLIYCAITGFGPTGPYKDRPSYDMVSQAASGYLSTLMEFSDPWCPNPGAGDQLTGMYAAYGILAALLERERTCKGQLVEISMIDSMIAFSAPLFANVHATGELPGREARASVSQSYVFLCADNKALVIHLSSPEHFWRNLTQALNRADLVEEPRFNSRPNRIANYPDLKSTLAQIFATKDRPEWLSLLYEHDVPCAPAYTLDEVPDDPQVRHLGTFVEVAHPTEGIIQRIRRPVIFGGRRDEPISLPPLVGEHTDEILATLRKSGSEIECLRRKQII